MNTKGVEKLISQFNRFTDSEKQKFADYILDMVGKGINPDNDGKKIFQIRSEVIGNRPSCPHCSGENESVVKNGHHNGVQKYICGECGKSFRDMTGSFGYRLRAIDKLPRFIELMLESKSIRYIAKELKMGKQTVFDWRHKILSSLNETFTKEFMGIVEVDDVYMRFNQKGRRSQSGTFIDQYRRTYTTTNAYGNRVSRRIDGLRRKGVSDEQVAVLFCLDRYKTVGMKMLRKGKINTASVSRIFNSDFDNRFNYGNIVVTDGETAYNRAFNGKLYSHETVVIDTKKKRFKRGFFHLNTLNNVDGRFKNWVKNNFSSVATKYLENYLNYFKMLFFVLSSDNGSEGSKENGLLRFALADNKAYSRMKSIEDNYWKFLEY